MDDLQFRRRAYAEPDSQDKEFVDVLHASAENERLVDELKCLDKKIIDAFSVDPPEGLAERIRLKQTLDQHQQGRNRMRALFSIAASLVIATAVMLAMQLLPDQHDLEGQLVDHVYEELHHLDDDFNYSTAKTNQVLESFGIQLSQDIGHIKYVGKCDIDSKQGVHMVLKGEAGPITVFMMPHSRVGKVIPVSDSRFVGRIEPLSKGSLAIIAEKGEQLDALDRNLRDSLKWVF